MLVSTDDVPTTLLFLRFRCFNRNIDDKKVAIIAPPGQHVSNSSYRVDELLIADPINHKSEYPTDCIQPDTPAYVGQPICIHIRPQLRDINFVLVYEMDV